MIINSFLIGGIRKKRVQLLFVGNSITDGRGTTGNDGVPGHGTNSFPHQTERLLNDANIIMVKLGYPGQTASGYSSSQMAIDVALLSSAYDIKICVIDWGANGAAYASISTLYNEIKVVHAAFKTAGAQTIAVPILNRKDIYSTETMDSTRLGVNALMFANWATFSDGIARLDNQPNIYSSNAPDNPIYFAENDVDGLTAVHPADAGAGLMAIEVAKVIKQLIAV